MLSAIRKFSKKTPLIAAALFILSGAILLAGFNTFMEATNTLPFCISCHEMESTVYQDYKHTEHFRNPSGVRAICSDCHVPKEWTAKVVRKIRASMELYHWLVGSINTPEKFDNKRHELATRVWETMKQSNSRECRSCHQFSVMELAGQAKFSARIHQDAMESGDTCIDCHRGITHKLPSEEQAIAKAGPKLDREYAEDIFETCAGCHGEFGEGTIDGEYPRLAGLDADYITLQLRHFKTRERLNIPMFPYATERELPDEDVVQIAAYLSQISLPAKLTPIDQEKEFNAFARLQASGRVVNIARYPGNIDSGHRFYRKECAGCHGKLAEGKNDRRNSRKIPPLAGQHSNYLLRQINKFSSGERQHDDPRDAGIFKSFSDAEIGDMLAYLSVLDD